MDRLIILALALLLTACGRERPVDITVAPSSAPARIEPTTPGKWEQIKTIAVDAKGKSPVALESGREYYMVIFTEDEYWEYINRAGQKAVDVSVKFKSETGQSAEGGYFKKCMPDGANCAEDPKEHRRGAR